MTSLVRVHDSVSGLAIKQGFSYCSRVVGSEFFANSLSLAVIMGVGPLRTHVMDSQCIRSVALKMGVAGSLIWFAAERCTYGGGSAVRAFAFHGAFSVSG